MKGDRVFLSDFGIALDWEHSSRSTTTADSAKSVLYAAPEVVRYERRNTSADVWSLGCVFMEMVTVLKGETIGEMRTFFANRFQSGNYLFYANIECFPHWARRLGKTGTAKDNQILPWVREMLKEKASDRPTAASLFEAITDDCREHQVPFCGSCCLEDEEGSDFFDEEEGDDVWADAVDMT